MHPHSSPYVALAAWVALCVSLAGLTAVIPSVALPSVASADGTADEADLHFQLGNDAYRAGQYLEALEHFLASNRLAPNRNVVYNIARCYQRIDRFPEAYRYYLESLEGETDPETRGRIESALSEISPRVALIDVTSTPAGATIYVDREDLGSVGRAPRTLALPAGTYRILATLDGYHDAASAATTVAVGERASVTIELSRVVGTLALRGETGTEVRIDTEEGEPLCTLPCELALPPGPHVVHARAEGRETLARAVVIVEGASISIDLSLEV